MSECVCRAGCVIRDQGGDTQGGYAFLGRKRRHAEYRQWRASSFGRRTLLGW